jgi:hypothetical protein
MVRLDDKQLAGVWRSGPIIQEMWPIIALTDSGNYSKLRENCWMNCVVMAFETIPWLRLCLVVVRVRQVHSSRTDIEKPAS